MARCNLTYHHPDQASAGLALVGARSFEFGRSLSALRRPRSYSAMSAANSIALDIKGDETASPSAMR
jgi:hypothetical protein